MTPRETVAARARTRQCPLRTIRTAAGEAARGTSLRRGSKIVPPSGRAVVGNAAGVYRQVVAVAFGLGTLVQGSITLYTVVTLVGAAYLAYLGVQTFRHRRTLAAALDSPAARRALQRILADALVVGCATAGLRQPLGAARGRGTVVARRVAAPPGGDRRHRRAGHRGLGAGTAISGRATG